MTKLVPTFMGVIGCKTFHVFQESGHSDNYRTGSYSNTLLVQLLPKSLQVAEWLQSKELNLDEERKNPCEIHGEKLKLISRTMTTEESLMLMPNRVEETFWTSFLNFNNVGKWASNWRLEKQKSIGFGINRKLHCQLDGGKINIFFLLTKTKL